MNAQTGHLTFSLISEVWFLNRLMRVDSYAGQVRDFQQEAGFLPKLFFLVRNALSTH